VRGLLRDHGSLSYWTRGCRYEKEYRAAPDEPDHGRELFGRHDRPLPATSEAKAALHMKDFTKKIAGDCRNMAILLNEIGGSCHALASDPMLRFQEILAEKKGSGGRHE
jgi:hypothetical protein